MVLLTAPLVRAATSACELRLAPHVTRDHLERFERETGFDFSALTTESSLETFYHRGLPYLARLARENGSTVSKVVEDQYALFRLGLESDESLAPEDRREHLEFLENLNDAFGDVPTLLRAGRPTEANADQLARAEIFLRVVTFGFTMTQLEHADHATINPFADFDEVQLERLFTAIEDGVFDRVLNAFTSRGPEPAVAGSTVAEAPSPATTTRPTSEAPRPASTNLATALKTGEPLRADQSYAAATAHGLTYRVQLSRALVKDLGGRHGHAAHRLLRTIFTGRGDSGINPLDNGPGVIEIKAVMNGRYRIIGCLEGLDLRLLKLMNIKEHVGAYRKRIPADLCR